MLKDIPVILNAVGNQVKQIVGGIAGRLRSLVATIDRLDRLETGTGEWKSGFVDSELPAAAQEMTLRAMRVGSDKINFNILEALSVDQSVTIPALIEATKLQRLELTERLNDLVQVGFATRLIDTDYAQLTEAGLNFHLLIKGISESVSQEFIQDQKNKLK